MQGANHYIHPAYKCQIVFYPGWQHNHYCQQWQAGWANEQSILLDGYGSTPLWFFDRKLLNVTGIEPWTALVMRSLRPLRYYSATSKFLKNEPFPVSFFVFSAFNKQTLQYLQQYNVKKCTSSIQCWDSNSPPLERKSPPITTRPGLPPPQILLILLM